jgi:ADP-ribose pyrophosphatase YjhB (NUDIX family)
MDSRTFRVGSGAIVLREDRLLMVHIRDGALDFWIPPGGGMEIGEGALVAAEREAFEETGLRVHAERIIYVQEVLDAHHHQITFWVLCSCDCDEPHLGNRMTDELDVLLEARFVSREEILRLHAVPVILRDSFWEDYAAGFPGIKYLDLGMAVPLDAPGGP